MPDIDQPQIASEKPLRVEFEIEKKLIREETVIIKEATKDEPAVTKVNKVYTTQDEAVDLALQKAKEMGYGKVSLQNYTQTGYLFIAYEILQTKPEELTTNS